MGAILRRHRVLYINQSGANFLRAAKEEIIGACVLDLSHLLFDLSGVMVVDTMVADQIFKIVDALCLLGVETILIGIRPVVAQTMVSLGMGFSKLTIRGNLEQALKQLQSSIEIFS